MVDQNIDTPLFIVVLLDKVFKTKTLNDVINVELLLNIEVALTYSHLK
jgi:hypothetical protein